MADSLSISMGGRIANIYKQNVKRRRFTSVTNHIESKRLGFITKQLEYDRQIEHNRMERNNDKMTNANDEMKAFQHALLKRIGIVKEQSKLTSGVRPPLNLGRYGGATVEYIKAESEKYKRIRDPKKRRMIKAKIFLEQGKRDGRIKEFEPEALGNLTENILKLYKADIEGVPKRRSSDIASLFDFDDIVENHRETQISNFEKPNFEAEATKLGDVQRATYPPMQPRLLLPPLQVKRSINPNANYYRKISADYHKREATKNALYGKTSPIHRRISLLEDITEEGDNRRRRKDKGLSNDSMEKVPNHTEKFTSKFTKFPVTSISNYSPQQSREPEHGKGSSSKLPSFEWDYTKPVGPVKVGKHLNDGQKFWKPEESVPQKQARKIALPKIK